MRFFDASALIKRYVREPHSTAVRRSLRSGPVVISRLSEVEVVSGLAGLGREGANVPPRRDQAIAAFTRDIAAWHVVELSSEVTALARALLLRHPLRSGDAIQLASALRLQEITHLPLTAFVAYDARLLAAAAAEGLTTI